MLFPWDESVQRGNLYFSPRTVSRKVILLGDQIRVIYHAFPVQQTAQTETLIQKAKFKVMDFSQLKAKHVIKALAREGFG